MTWRRRLVAAFAALALGGCGESGPAVVAIPAGDRWQAIVQTLPAEADLRSSNICGRGERACIEEVVAEMRRRLGHLSRACDHNAPFAFMYLRVTDGVGVTGGRRFRDPRYLNHLDAVFAQLYFRAFDAWRAGRGDRVPEAWRIAFEAADERAVVGIGDMLLGMNAHISRDLPFALVSAGLRTPRGSSGKPDFDRVNELLTDVQDPMIREAARRFDPSIASSTLPYSELGSSSVAELLARWRTEAWHNAKAITAARGDSERDHLAGQIETAAAGRARMIAALTSNLVIGPGAAQRRRHCEAGRLEAATRRVGG